MNFKSVVGRAFAVAGLAAGLLASAPATAGVKGQMILDLTDGCFATTGPGCGQLPQGALAYGAGQFHFTDTLLSVYGGTAGLATQQFKYFGEIEMNAGSTSSNVAPFYADSASWPNYAALSADPVMQFGFGILQAMFAQGNSGVLPLDPTHTIFYDLTNTSGPDNDYMGDFAAWSFDDFNDVSLALFGQPLPADAFFNIHVQLTAIPEPASMALVGLGLLGLGVLRRRKVA
ncbi:MAG: PEP-CTERM sorting domain-containing protein [Candidatus Accumulibacter sp.]|nr:PEP-CTERM sorting domain-containing protein [Accumulibacter sp.]